MLISSPLIGIATSLDVLEIPAFTLSPVHTGAVHCDLLVGLSNSQIIISVTCGKIIKFYCRAAACKCLLRQRLSSVTMTSTFVSPVVSVRVGYFRFDIDLILLVKDRPHCISVQGIQDGQIVVLCSVIRGSSSSRRKSHPRKVVGEHNASCRVGVAPVAFVVVLIVGRRHDGHPCQGLLCNSCRREISELPMAPSPLPTSISVI